MAKRLLLSSVGWVETQRRAVGDPERFVMQPSSFIDTGSVPITAETAFDSDSSSWVSIQTTGLLFVTADWVLFPCIDVSLPIGIELPSNRQLEKWQDPLTRFFDVLLAHRLVEVWIIRPFAGMNPPATHISYGRDPNASERQLIERLQSDADSSWTDRRVLGIEYSANAALRFFNAVAHAFPSAVPRNVYLPRVVCTTRQGMWPVA